jgi:hypothetical protein
MELSTRPVPKSVTLLVDSREKTPIPFPGAFYYYEGPTAKHRKLVGVRVLQVRGRPALLIDRT